MKLNLPPMSIEEIMRPHREQLKIARAVNEYLANPVPVTQCTGYDDMAALSPADIAVDRSWELNGERVG